MKIVISKFIIIVMLVISSVSVCLAKDNSCEDRPGYSQSQSAQSASDSNQDEDHHCLCSLSCHNLLIGFSSEQTKSISIIITSSPFIYIQATYPQVLISHDKPPII